MRKLFYTILLSLFSFVSLLAGESEWNISSSDFNALGKITSTTTINGLTIYATEEKAVTVDSSGISINGSDYTSRLKLGGAGNIATGAEYRAVSFKVTGNSTITVASMSSSDSIDRELLLVNGTTGDTLNFFPALGDSISMIDYKYVGDSTALYLLSKASGINIYFIKLVTEEPVVPVEPVITDSYAIFDPATVDTSKLADGMSIIELNGKKYLQVIVNSWSSLINVPEFKFEPGMTAFAEFKYTIGQKQFTASQINAAIQLNDTINKMTVSWSTTPVNSTTGLIQSNPSGLFVKTSANAAATMKVVHQVQFFGQETSGWSAVVGDTILVGKIRAYKVDKNTIFDPITYDPDYLTDGMSVVEVGGKKYLQVVVNAWNSTVNVPEFKLNDGVTAFAEFKYKVGQTQFAASQINAAVQLIDTINKTTVSWSTTPVNSTTGIMQSNPSGKFVKSSSSIAATMKVVHQVQFFGQETSSWGAVVGDTLWVGKVRAYKADPLAVLDPAICDESELPEGINIVTIGTKKYFRVILNGWNSTIFVDPITIKEGYNAQCDIKYALGETSLAAGLKPEKINGVVQLMDTINTIPNPWGGTGNVPSSTGLSQSPVTGNIGTLSAALTKEMKLVNEVQFFGQETVGWTPTIGDTLWCGKISLFDPTASITFIVDDSNLKTSTGFALKGSWKKATGVYDTSWDGGIELTKFYDDGTNGDKKAGDHIWSVTVELVVDNGANSWEWGIDDSKGKWILVGANQKFTLPDATNQTLTYTNTVSSKNLSTGSFKVYPNPCHDLISIDMNNVKSVEIFNLAGSKVLETSLNGKVINVSSLKPGCYFMKVKSADGQEIKSRFSKN